MNEPKKRKLSDVMLRWEFKFTVTIFLLALAFVQYTRSPEIVSTLCLCGMAFSTLGDLLLMDYMRVPSYVFKGKQFYAGAASFAIAHVFYRQMFRTLTPEHSIFALGEIITLILLVMIVVAIYKTKLKKKSKWFFAAVGFYTGIILSNLAAAINCTVALGGRYGLATIGVVCFIISDLFLFIRETMSDTPLVRKLVWVFYPLAQILIIMNV